MSYEKKIPRAFIGSRGQRKPKGVSVLIFHRPSHIPSDFVVLVSKPERFLKLLKCVGSTVEPLYYRHQGDRDKCPHYKRCPF